MSKKVLTSTEVQVRVCVCMCGHDSQSERDKQPMLIADSKWQLHEYCTEVMERDERRDREKERGGGR